MTHQHHEDQGDGRLCVIDQRRYPTRGNVCDACRSWLGGKLAAIPRLYADMLAEPAPTGGRDPITLRLPAGPKPGASSAPRVSGSTEGRTPARLTVVDLSLPARNGAVVDLHLDQYGHLSVATELDQIVRDWRDTLWPSSVLPEADVASLCRWMGDRLDDACDRHPAIDEHAETIKKLGATLVGVLGLIEVDDYKHGIPCRGCDMLTLRQRNGSGVIDCENCPEIMTPEEYHRWVGLVAARFTDMTTIERRQLMTRPDSPALAHDRP